MTSAALALAALLSSAASTPSAQAQGAAAAADGLFLSRAELLAKYPQPAGRTIKVEGVDVYYTDEGRGPPILMAPGSVSTLETYDGVVAALKSRYRIIRYDVPPNGRSGSLSDEAAANLHPTDIAAGLLDRLGLKSVVVVGVSSGGTLGVQLAAVRPDLVSRLILSNTPSDPVDTSHMHQPQAFLDAQKEAARSHFQSQEFWNQFLDYFSADPTRMTPKIRAEYYDFNRRRPEKHAIALVAQVADHAQAVKALNGVTAPTLLVWGGADPLLTPPTADALRNYLVHAQVSLVIMPDVGHFPPLEAPERFARIVDDYLVNVAPSSPR
jgi:pimeloyl-ACP methyl ester carboxylesterase